jgi:hypothetical protein
MTTGGVNAAPKWIDSKGKQLLLQDLLSGRISLKSPREWTAKRDYNLAVYNLADRPQFRLYPYNNFVTNFRNLRKKVLQETVSSATDSHALAHDRSIHPVAPFNQLGEPRWEGSSAQKLLSADIDDAKHTRMKPQILHGTREEYGVFDLTVFRKHIRQEVQTRKLLAYHAEKKRKKDERRNL